MWRSVKGDFNEGNCVRSPPNLLVRRGLMQIMDFREIGRLVSEDKKALEFLWKRQKNAECPFFETSDFYFIGRGRVRCRSCKRDIWPLQNTRFSLMKISPSQWISLIKLFELSISARKAASDVGLSYKTALKAYDILLKLWSGRSPGMTKYSRENLKLMNHTSAEK